MARPRNPIMTAPEFKNARGCLNMSQIRLAKFIRVSERQIARYENGASAVPGPVHVLMRTLVNRKMPPRPRKRTRTKN